MYTMTLTHIKLCIIIIGTAILAAHFLCWYGWASGEHLCRADQVVTRPVFTPAANSVPPSLAGAAVSSLHPTIVTVATVADTATDTATATTIAVAAVVATIIGDGVIVTAV